MCPAQEMEIKIVTHRRSAARRPGLRSGDAARGILGPLVVLLTVPVAEPAFAQDAASVMDGVYSLEQASRGELVFSDSCARCHESTEFVGPDFRSAWDGRPVGGLYILIRRSMPDDDPNSLTPQEYTDVVAYLLAANGYPHGSQELPVSPGPLNRIRFVMRPEEGEQ